MRIAVLMTCFNRKALTLTALRLLMAGNEMLDASVEIFLVDDGSRDGTSDAVRQEFPEIHLLQGDGSLYWNGGMRVAFAKALSVGFDAYVLFNDDTLLIPGALIRLVETARQCEQTIGPTIVVGSMQDQKTGMHSYGGFVQRTHGLHMELVPVPADPDKLVPCETMNANFVLIPAAAAAKLGNLESTFTHQWADLDYGLRATAEGIPIRIAPGYLGTCSDNPQTATWRDRTQPLSTRWRHLMSPKGAPVAEWIFYTRRHFGWRWPLYALSPYLKTLVGR